MKALQIILYVSLVLSLLSVPLAGCASKPLTLTIYQPQHGTTSTSSPIRVQGSVSDPKATVKIYNTKVSVSKTGSFSAKVELKEGENTIKISATRGKKSVSRTLTVTYQPEPELTQQPEEELEQKLEEEPEQKPEEELEHSFVFSFEKDMEGWKASGTDLDDSLAEWSIERSQDIVSDGETSVMLYLNNINAAGKIWIERLFEIEPNRTYEVRVMYDLASADWGDVNLWTIITGVVPTSAETELVYQGDTGNNASPEDGFVWLGKSYDFIVDSGPEGEVLAIIGVWGTWETARTYYLDNVSISFTSKL